MERKYMPHDPIPMHILPYIPNRNNKKMGNKQTPVPLCLIAKSDP